MTAVGYGGIADRLVEGTFQYEVRGSYVKLQLHCDARRVDWFTADTQRLLLIRGTNLTVQRSKEVLNLNFDRFLADPITYSSLATSSAISEMSNSANWRACDGFMESGLARFLENDLHGALNEFLMAKKNFCCEDVLMCCAALSFILHDYALAKEHMYRAKHNRDGPSSDTSFAVYQHIWDEYMDQIICQQLVGEAIDVRYTEPLPALSSCFQSTSKADSQYFETRLCFTPAIERRGNEVRVTLTLKQAEFGVAHFLKSGDFQGYFVYEYEIDASPGELWKFSCELETVSPGVGRNAQPVQQQRGGTYSAQVGTSGSSPGGNMGYTYSDLISTSSYPEQMIACKAPGDETVFRSTWRVNTYKDGHAFAKNGAEDGSLKVRSVWKVHELPFDPAKFVCSDSGEFQGVWKITSEEARKLHYHFDWDITLKAKLALVPRKRKRDIHRNLIKALLPSEKPCTHTEICHSRNEPIFKNLRGPDTHVTEYGQLLHTCTLR